MTRIAVLDDYLKIAPEVGGWDRLPDGASVDFFHDHLDEERAIIERCAPYDVIVLTRERTTFTRDLIESLPNLKLLITVSARNRKIDFEACRERGIPVCHTLQGSGPTSEHTWALILALYKNLLLEDRSMRAGEWGVAIGREVLGKRLGLVGLGKLGKKVARVGLAFEMDVVAWSPNLTDERAAEAGVKRVSKEELFATSDIVSVHIVLSDRTRGVVGRDDIARMKKTACLINTSRGPLVDEAALVDALRSGAIAGAGLDVYDQEPLPLDHPLRDMPNIVVTPHTGGFTRETYTLWYGGACENVLAWLNGKPIRILQPPK
ncbi:MAG: D-2-hydroxyacid dehydrogenase family protein [Acetobacterales bacterium]